MYENLMEAAVADENYELALGAVKRNHGAAGIDRMSTAQLEPHLQANWWILKDKLLKGTYVPTPVRRVEIPKPSGGTRMLGIPTVQDRFIQQLLLQVLTPIFDPSSASTVMGSGRDAAHRTPCEPHSSMRREGRSGWWISTSPSFWIRLHTAPGLLKRFGCCSTILIRKPLRRPCRTNTASSSPRFTRCNTVCRETPSFIVASSIGQILRWRLLDDARAQFIGDSNLPRCAGSYLLAGDEAIGQPAMNRGRVHAENPGSLANGHQFSVGRRCRRLEPRNASVTPQTANLVGRETFSGCRFAPLTIEDSGDDFIGIEGGQPGQQRDDIFVGSRPHGFESRDRHIQYGDGAATPSQSQMGTTLGALEIQDHFLEQRAQQFLAIAVRGGRGIPHFAKIGAEPKQRFQLCGSERGRALLLAFVQFRFGIRHSPQTCLPFGFQTACDETVFRIHAAVAALGPFGFEAGTFHFQMPLRQRRIVVRFQLLDRHARSFDRGRRNRLQEMRRPRLARSPFHRH